MKFLVWALSGLCNPTISFIICSENVF